MNLLETLKQIQKTTIDATAPQLFHSDRHIDRYAIGGEVLEVIAKPPAIDFLACDIETLGDHTTSNSAIWHRGDQVIAVVDATSEHRDDRVTLNLMQSSKWTALLFEAHKKREHASFIRFLVLSLRDELDTSAPGLLGLLRSLNFKTVDAGDGNIQHGKESMGRSVQMEITGANDLPETVTIKLRRWAKLDIFVEVECLIVLDTETRTLALQPLADATEIAEDDAQRQLHELLVAATEGSVNYGYPGQVA